MFNAISSASRSGSSVWNSPDVPNPALLTTRSIGRWVRDASHDRADAVRRREIRSHHLDTLVACGQFLEPVDTPGDDHLRYPGFAEELHHRLADPARRSGDQRRREWV